MQYPESGITYTRGHEDTEPVDEDGNFDTHCYRAVEHGTEMNILSNVSTNLK